jgi:hypothetical protein
MSFDEQKQELKQFLNDEQKQELKQFLNEEKRFRSWVHCQPIRSSQDSNFTKTSQRVFIVIKQSINFNKGQIVIFVRFFLEESRRRIWLLKRFWGERRWRDSFKEDKEEEGGYRELCGNRFVIIIRSWDKINATLGTRISRKTESARTNWLITGRELCVRAGLVPLLSPGGGRRWHLHHGRKQCEEESGPTTERGDEKKGWQSEEGGKQWGGEGGKEEEIKRKGGREEGN